MIKNYFLKWFLYFLRASNAGQGGIFQWDLSRSRLSLKSSQNLSYFKAFCYFGWLFVAIITVQVVLGKGVLRPLLFQSILFMIVFVSSLYIQLTLFQWRMEVVANFNAILDFEEMHYRKSAISF